MLKYYLLCTSILLLGGCSDAPRDDLGEDEATAIEKQIEGDAKSLEAAADEAVKELKSEIEADLSDDGIATPIRSIPPTE
ncbi:hypothetical protein GCM10009096_25200 [Parasphingorhabdus litoris]|uniref:Secreted protein n=1 Tax=Parasphingorhabdus litoris TaxID=394733 RepID=A0ABP3KL39_9SPHN|nr:hypothetical protein [Parasphingorhabdus litoris]